jgi:hypothetical protein
MKKKEMNKPTRPTNRQINNEAREKGLLVGWMTRAVVHGDASTLGMAGDIRHACAIATVAHRLGLHRLHVYLMS